MGTSKRFGKAADEQIRIEKKVKAILTAHGAPPRFNHFYMNFGKKLARIMRDYSGPAAMSEACVELRKWYDRELDPFILEEILYLFMANSCAPFDARYVLTQANATLVNSVVHPNTGAPAYNVTHNISDLTADADLNLGAHNIGLTGYIAVGTLVLAAGSITDTTGLIGFGNENLITTGQINAGIGFQTAGFVSGGTISGTNVNWDAAFAHVSATGASHTYINQSVTTTSSPTFNRPTVSSLYLDRSNSDYLVTSRSGYFFVLQEQLSGVQPSFELFSKDGDGTDNANMIMWAVGLPSAITNREFMQYGYIAAGPYFKVNTDAAGTGTVRPLYLYAGSANSHIQLLANGDVLMPDVYSDIVGGTNRDLYIDNTGKLGYVVSSLKYKTNIRDLAGSERIHQLRPVMFDRKDGTAKDEVGLIAEEVLEVMPELVNFERSPIMGTRKNTFNEDEQYVSCFETTNQPETVNYSQLIVPLLLEVQRLRARVEALEKKA